MKSFNILVVCTGNICRSPMAEGLLRHELPENFQEKVAVASAGTDALHGNWATDSAIMIMQEYGVDILPHRARLLSRQMVIDADLILAMEHYHLKIIKRLRRKADSKSFLISTFARMQSSFAKMQSSFAKMQSSFARMQSSYARLQTSVAELQTPFEKSRSFDTSQAPYEIPDPIGGDLNRYRESARLIHGCLAGVYAYIEEQHEI